MFKIYYWSKFVILLVQASKLFCLVFKNTVCETLFLFGLLHSKGLIYIIILKEYNTACLGFGKMTR